MKRIILLISLIITGNSFAQLAKKDLPKPKSIKGKVIDKTKNEALPYVNIVIRDFAKKIITGGITDDNGIFTVKDIPKGKSIVDFQFVGFKKCTKQVNITNQK
mgnify:CR=1 FL=1|jgi:hypothetical protein|tara:strand:+ start:346 stop:654 length:309 start_codon:yes stop_codon:yes gene_type:complete